MRHAVLGCEDEMFYEGHNTSCGLGCEALSHLSHVRKNTCAEVSNAYASGLSVVFTGSVSKERCAASIGAPCVTQNPGMPTFLGPFFGRNGPLR